jgi:hypothetical protein
MSFELISRDADGRVTGSIPITATIPVSPKRGNSRRLEQAVSAGILAGIVPLFWSPETPAVSGRFLTVSLCSKNSVPTAGVFGGQNRLAVREPLEVFGAKTPVSNSV